MRIFLFGTWWKSLSIDLHVFLSISIVFSTLLIILYILSYFRIDGEQDLTIEQIKERSRQLSTKVIITFFTLFGWSGTLISFLSDNLTATFIYSTIIGIGGTVLLRWFFTSTNANRNFRMEKALSSTGKVLSSIPPHRNGFGKVHLNIREAPYEIDAITAGHELPRGASVKVVEILDEKIVLVEPIIQGKIKKHRRRFDIKTTRTSTTGFRDKDPGSPL